jgi:hypothetical protein
VKDGLGSAILLDEEVIFGQAFYESASLVANRCQQFDQVHVRRKGHVLRPRPPQCRED